MAKKSLTTEKMLNEYLLIPTSSPGSEVVCKLDGLLSAPMIPHPHHEVTPERQAESSAPKQIINEANAPNEPPLFE